MTIIPLNPITFNKPFLVNASPNVIKYYEASCRMMQNRIDTRMNTFETDIDFLQELDDIWYSLTEEEIQQVEKLPRMWWFQYSDENGLTQKSELDVYPYAQYFVNQKPHLLGEDVSHMKGKPYFGDKTWKPNTPVMFLMIQEEKEGELYLNMVTMSNEHYEELQRDYDFVQYAHVCPIFKKKGTSK